MTILAITIQQANGLDSSVDQRFGRAPNFLIVDTQSGEVRAVVPNEAAEAAHAAGPAAARIVAQHQAEAVASGRFGPKAADALGTLGIRKYEVGAASSARAVLEAYNNGSLREIS